MNESGINVTFIIHDLLGTHIVTNLRNTKSSNALDVGRLTVEDDLKPIQLELATNLNNKSKQISYSKSVETLKNCLSGYTELALSTKHLIIRNECFMAIETSLEAYFHVCVKVVDEKSTLSESDLQMVIQNVLEVDDFIQSTTLSHLNELHDFFQSFSSSTQQRSITGRNKVIEASLGKYCPFLATQIYKLNDLNLGEDEGLGNNQLPSHTIVSVVFKLKKFGSNLAQHEKEIINQTVVWLLMEFQKDIYWMINGKIRTLGVGGVETMMLDIQYLIRSFEFVMSEQIKQQGKFVMERSIKSYFERCQEVGKQPKQVKPTEWFEKQVQIAIAEQK